MAAGCHNTLIECQAVFFAYLRNTLKFEKSIAVSLNLLLPQGAVPPCVLKLCFCLFSKYTIAHYSNLEQCCKRSVLKQSVVPNYHPLL